MRLFGGDAGQWPAYFLQKNGQMPSGNENPASAERNGGEVCGLLSVDGKKLREKCGKMAKNPWIFSNKYDMLGTERKLLPDGAVVGAAEPGV